MLAEVAVLEDVPASDQDWHPNSNNQVLDLVHPSLFCVRDLKTERLLARQKLPSVASHPHHHHPSGGYRLLSSMFAPTDVVTYPADRDFEYFSDFQWLPAEFAIPMDDDGRVSIDSYINNLHPVKFARLYGVLESIFQRFVPLFEGVLTHLSAPAPASLLSISGCYWYGDGEPPKPAAFGVYIEDEYDSELDYDLESEWSDYWYEHRVPSLPSLPEVHRPLRPPPSAVAADAGSPVVSLRGRTVQVIVKMAAIHLTPENPVYEGGTWHVEGTDNESIVATGIYYFDQHNVTPSRLAFRVPVDEPEYEPSDHGGAWVAYGLGSDVALSQHWGAVATVDDRCLVFPNVFQHQVERFELEDKQQPGFRKILVFSLWIRPSACS